MMNEKISITIPYRGYVKSLGLFGPVVQPISVTKAQALVLLRSGLQVVRVDRAGKHYVLTSENINNLCVVDTVNTDTVTTVPKVNTSSKEVVAETRTVNAVAVEETSTEEVKNYAWYQANIDTLTVEEVTSAGLTKKQTAGLVKKIETRLAEEATPVVEEIVEPVEEATPVVEETTEETVEDTIVEVAEEVTSDEVTE